MQLNISAQFYSLPEGAKYINDPENMNEMAEYSCREIRGKFKELGKIPDLPDRMRKYKRDLIYLAEVSESEDEVPYCAALAMRMNLGMTKEPDVLQKPITLNRNLRQRVIDLISCCDADTLRLH